MSLNPNGNMSGGVPREVSSETDAMSRMNEKRGSSVAAGSSPSSRKIAAIRLRAGFPAAAVSSVYTSGSQNGFILPSLTHRKSSSIRQKNSSSRVFPRIFSICSYGSRCQFRRRIVM